MVYFPSGLRWFDAIVVGVLVTVFAVLSFFLAVEGASSLESVVVTGLAIMVGVTLLGLGLWGGHRAGWKPTGPR
jgi:hypothetical protein